MVGILCFPAGWDNDNVRGICGKEANDYALGLCGIRWAFVMAFICKLEVSAQRSFIETCLKIVFVLHDVLHHSDVVVVGEVNSG